MNDLLVYFFATILIVSVIGIYGLITLSEINSSLDELSTDSSYLYYKISEEDNIKSDGIVFEKIDGVSMGGLHVENTYIYLNIRNQNNKNVCLIFLHELGHKVCAEDFNNSESCANFFRENNLYRCEGLQ